MPQSYWNKHIKMKRYMASTLDSCFLPKKPSFFDDDGTPCYLASDTRPLCIVDTANRLMANAARLRWEQHLEGWLAKEQHGFLPCRSMLSNVVDLELAAMHATLEHEDPAIMLFDFSAAFPSISQEFLFRTLENLGLPRAAVQLVKSLYFNHKGFPVLEGARGTGFCMSAGIRQGCPLSPLLFVVAVDGLLRRVGRESPGTSPWMFADDTSMVMQNFREALPRIAIIFKDLQEAAHLSLKHWQVHFYSAIY
jgi:hypothetical protein